MSNNIDVTPGTGKTVATEDLGGAQYQKIKVVGGQIGSTSVLGVNPDGSINASIIGLPTFLIGGSIAAVVTSNPNQSVSGAITFPAGSVANVVNPAGSVTQVRTDLASVIGVIQGSIAAVQSGLRITSVVSSTPSSMLVGASIFGQLPAGTATIGATTAPAGSVMTVATLAGSVMAVSATAPAGSILSVTNPAGSVTAVSATIIAGSVMSVTNPAGSVTGVRTDSASVIAIFQNSSLIAVPTGNQSVSGAVTAPAGSVLTIATLAGSVVGVSATAPAGSVLSITHPAGSVTGVRTDNASVITTQLGGSVLTVATLAGSVMAVSATQPAGSLLSAIQVAGSVMAVRTDNASVIAISTAVGSVITTFAQSPSIVGTFAEDAASTSADKGLFVLGVRNDAVASLVNANLDYGAFAQDSAGRNVTKPFSPEESRVEGYNSVVSGSVTTLIAAAGAGLKNYITDVVLVNTGAVATLVTFKSGGGTSVLGYGFAPAAGGSNMIGWAMPMRTLANETFDFQATTSTSILFAKVSGFKAP